MYAAMSGADGPIHLTLNGINKNVTLGAPIAFQTATDGSTDKVGISGERSSGLARCTRRLLSFRSTGRTQHQAVRVRRPGRRLPRSRNGSKTTHQSRQLPSQPSGAVNNRRFGLALLTVDESAAVDTETPYGDVGSVPFDTVTADIFWPTGVQQTALISINGAPSVVSGTCTTVTCNVTIESAGYPLPELKITKPALVVITLANGTTDYVPADGVPLTASVPVTSTPAPLTITNLTVTAAASAPKATLSATFTDAYTGPVSSKNYTARVAWGDGRTTTAKVTVNSQGSKAAAAHQYAHAGVYTVTITITDSGGATVSGSQTITVH